LQHPSSANSANLFGEEKERVSKNIACLKEIVLGEKPKSTIAVLFFIYWKEIFISLL